MYRFIDVNETSEGTLLPSEALQINGEFIENLIKGYRTLTVTGREALSPELETSETGNRDGSELKYKRYPARLITVKYQLITESAEAFREAYNKLGDILNVQNAELIFNDEKDKFFTGTPSRIGEVKAGVNSVVGEFDLLCLDPFKYSVTEYEAEPTLDGNSILIDYGGTYKSFPILEANFYNDETAANNDGDCGYVAFFNENENIIQMGDPEEENIGNYEKSQTLINPYFTKTSAWNDQTEQEWVANSGYVLPTDIVQGGSVGMVPATYEAVKDVATSGTLLTKTKQSEDEEPIIYYTITAKASGRTPTAVNVTVAITAALAKSSNYFYGNRQLVGSIYMGGTWHDVIIKKLGVPWSGNSGHTVNVSFTVDGLEADTDRLTDIKFKAYRTDDLGKTGILDETTCNDLKISPFAERIPETYCLGAASYGASASKWHGVTITKQLPADAAGEAGAQNFTLTYSPRFKEDETADGLKQYGANQVQITAADGSHICGIRLYKNTVGRKYSLAFYAGGKLMLTKSITAAGTIKITKTGAKITYSIGAVSGWANVPTLNNAKAAKITFAFEQYAQQPAITYNGLYWAKFIKENCDTFKDIPNKFTTNDVLEADCSTGEILLNGLPSAALGATGNDWEKFYLKKGINQIGFAYSDWVMAGCEPSFKIRYREVFL